MVVEIEHPKRRGVKWRQGIVNVGADGDVNVSTVVRKNPHRVIECVLTQVYLRGRLVDLKHIDVELLSASDDTVIDHKTRSGKRTPRQLAMAPAVATAHRHAIAERAGQPGFRGPRRAGARNRPIRMWRGGECTLVGEWIGFDDGFTPLLKKGKGERDCPCCGHVIGSANRVCPQSDCEAILW